MSAGSAGPTGTNPARLSTLRDAALSWVVAALSVRRPYRAAARRHSSRTVAVATPRPAACCATRYPKLRRVVLDEHQVEPAQYRAILGDEHVEGADAGLLLGQQRAVPLAELREELVATVGDRGGEVRAVRELEGEHRVGMVGSQALQLGHRPDSTQMGSAGYLTTFLV